MGVKELSDKELAQLVNILELITVDVPLLAGTDLVAEENYMDLFRRSGLVDEKGYVTPENTDVVYSAAYTRLVRLSELAEEKEKSE